ncbi:MAG: hypothetical protein U0M82_10070 [Bilophila wadsworthia]|jgi:hypothetical protein
MPRFPSLRSIPAQAVGLKKYRDGRSPVSKMSDKEDTTATMGNSDDFCHVTEIGHVWVVMRKHGTGKPFDL